MLDKICYWYFCFIPTSTPGQSEKIFGFSEYLTAVALLAVLFTITDFRYKFRLSITPSNLYSNSYVLLAVIGALSLITEVWIAEGWFVPVTFGLDYAVWQMVPGMLFLTTFLTWMYYAFINPPVFGKRNARRYANSLYWAIVKGSDEELKIIANELGRSAKELIRFVPEYPMQQKKSAKLDYRDFAHDMLLLIGNRRLCKHIVATSPVTAQAFFEEISAAKKFNIPISQFARNITAEAIRQKESFLYGEAEDGFYSGLLGYLKPISKALYGNFPFIEVLATNGFSPFDTEYSESLEWDFHQWNAYCKAALITTEDYLENINRAHHPYSIIRIFHTLEHASQGLYKFDGQEDVYESDALKRLSEVVDFAEQVISLINEMQNPPKPLSKIREGSYPKNIYDYLATLIFKICLEATSIKTPASVTWQIYYSSIWSRFFMHGEGKAWKVVRHKVRRLLYDEAVYLFDLPNYKSSRILGFCLNILIDVDKPTENNNMWRESYPLAKALQSKTSESYLQLIKANSDVAESVLIGSISFDEKNRRLIKTYIKGLSKEAPQTFLQLKSVRAKRKPRNIQKATG